MSALGQAVPVRHRGGDGPRTASRLLGRLAGGLAIPFVLLSVYGMLRWQTLLPSSMRLRCAGLLALGLVATALVSLAARGPGSRARAVALTVLALAAMVAMLPMAGFPLSWATHLRIAVTLRAIGNGIAALPGVTVPYAGSASSTRAVIALGAGILVLGSGTALATAQQAGGVGQRAVSALPLLVLAAVPSALGRPHLIVVHGVALLLLLVLLLLWERLLHGGIVAAATLVGVATLAAVPISGTLDTGHAWVSLSRLVSGLGPPSVANFDWSQSYGPLASADSGPSTTVLRVSARFPAYWKAENLDEFDGRGWSMAAQGLSDPLYPQQQLTEFGRSAQLRWDQQLTVTVGAMNSNRVIAAGTAGFPVSQRRPLGVTPASSPGTWRVQRPLSRGDRYTVDVYTPRPSAPQLESSGVRYPVAVSSTELSMQLPHQSGVADPPAVEFAQYGTAQRVIGGSQPTVPGDETMLLRSPYGGMYKLSQALEAGTTTPYGYVLAVLRYLGHGFTYTKNPPTSRYPIPGFLLDTKVGYCQQFAGAMALLLRMGGVPARVAVGFTTGTLNRRTHEYVVTNKDAHAWVEVWFPKYGWVSFDPTPSGKQSASAGLPVDSAHRPTPIQGGGQANAKSAGAPRKAHASSAPRTTVRHVRGARPVSTGVVTGVLIGLVVLVGIWFSRLTRRPTRRRRRIAAETLIGELERAFSRCGRPLHADVTLTALERRVASGDTIAAEYVARLGEARFGTGGPPPTSTQRRALRAWLAQGMGPVGRLRALLALPPRRLH